MKRKKKQQRPLSLKEKYTSMPADGKRRLFLTAAVGVVGMGAAAVALSSYEKKRTTLHDLTAIGEGLPVVVQIHDTSCPVCRRLKSRSEAVLGKRSDVLYRVADIASSEGQAMQKKFGAEKTTLLLFNGQGKHVNTHVGLASVEELESLFSQQYSIN